jgi:ATP-dependent helicase HrpA
MDGRQSPWLVPGYIESRVQALIKSLPKSVRRLFVPAAETAKKIVAALPANNETLESNVAAQLSALSGQRIKIDQFNLEKVDDYLHVNVQVVDEQGRTVAEGRNINELRKQLGLQAKPLAEVHDSNWHRDGLVEWTWGDLPPQVAVSRGASEVVLYPAIVDQTDSVGLRLATNEPHARCLTTAGVIRLLTIQTRRSLRQQIDWLPNFDKAAVELAWILETGGLRTGLADLIARIAFIEDGQLPRSRAEFDSLLSDRVERISIAAQQIARWLPRFADQCHAVHLRLDELRAGGSRYRLVLEDLTQQIGSLFADGFLAGTSWRWLQHYPRYLAASVVRCERVLGGEAQKDRELSAPVLAYWQKYQELADEHQATGAFSADLEILRWSIEEFRVSVFAQKLGTSFKVSPQRLDKQLQSIPGGCIRS